MTQIYLDNAATSWPKPPGVLQAMNQYWSGGGAAAGRSVGASASDVNVRLGELRRSLSEMIHAKPPEVMFAFNATDALNLAINGLMIAAIRRGDWCGDAAKKLPIKVVTTQAEHNSVLRPLHYWQELGRVKLEIVPCDRFGRVDLDHLCQVADGQTGLLCLNHASNVTGVVQDAAAVGAHCRRQGIVFLLDAAQTMGHLPMDVQTLGCDFLIAAGHKALLGPLGTAVLYVRAAIEPYVDCLRIGGTGTQSHSLLPPQASPEKWEAGNLNVAALLGLRAGVQFVNDAHGPAAGGAGSSVDHAQQLCSQLWYGLLEIPNMQVVANPGYNPFASESPESRMPLISCTSAVLSPAELAMALEHAGNFVTRAGYHCAPVIHQALGTADGGTLRLSPGPFNSPQHVRQLLSALGTICNFG